MNRVEEISGRLVQIFGEEWWDKRKIVATKSGYVDVYLFGYEAGRFSIEQYWGSEVGALPAPGIVFIHERET